MTTLERSFLAAFVVAPVALAGQDLPVLRISAPEIVYSRDFTDLRSLRPLSDGRAIAVEGLGGQVVLLSTDGSGASPVGARGEGPSEYMDPSAALPLASSDYTLLIDPAQQRLLIVSPDGDVIASEPWRLPMLTVPRARDATEGFYYDDAGSVRLDRNGDVIEGPAPLIRVQAGQAPDTLAMLTVYDLAERWEASAVSSMFSPGAGGVALFRLDRSPFGAQDTWALLPEGQIVVVRARPYRVEVHPAGGGAPRIGPELDVGRVRVTGEDRDAWVAAQGRGMVPAGGGFTSSSGERRDLPPPTRDLQAVRFPETKPAFPFGALHVSSEGDFFVQRHLAFGENRTLIDHFDQNGARVGQIELPADRTLVAAGPAALYAIHYDDFDVQILERYQR